MIPVQRTPLDHWVATRIGLPESQRLSPAHVAAYQLAQLNRTLAYTARNSPFYRRQWGNSTYKLSQLDDLPTLPFTTGNALHRSPLALLSISQRDVARIVTFQTSGTTGEPKRVFFSDEDLERTIDFFRQGMATLVRPGQRVLVLLPGALPDSVGDLLRRALARMDVTGIVHGPVQHPERTIQAIFDHHIDCLVGIPVQVLSLARHPDGKRIPPGKIRNVLLSTDYVPRSLVYAIQQAWGCAVFEHYGMTEMGYGGAVSCAAHEGYHLREADLLFEIIDPVTERPVGNGQVGEVVFTTLTRRAMPLIRYRTGDLAFWMDEACPCGSTLRRLGWVQGRRHEMVSLADGHVLTLARLDEALFAVPGVADFQAVLKHGHGRDRLNIKLVSNLNNEDILWQAAERLQQIPAIRTACTDSALVLEPITLEKGPGLTRTTAKRRMIIRTF